MLVRFASLALRLKVNIIISLVWIWSYSCWPAEWHLAFPDPFKSSFLPNDEITADASLLVQFENL